MTEVGRSKLRLFHLAPNLIGIIHSLLLSLWTSRWFGCIVNQSYLALITGQYVESLRHLFQLGHANLEVLNRAWRADFSQVLKEVSWNRLKIAVWDFILDCGFFAYFLDYLDERDFEQSQLSRIKSTCLGQSHQHKCSSCSCVPLLQHCCDKPASGGVHCSNKTCSSL